MSELTQQQKEAISDYFDLMQKHHECFLPREKRQIVCDRGTLERYAQEHDEVLGVVAETPYVYFVVDLVKTIGKDNQPWHYTYLRLLFRKQLQGAINTVVLGTIANPELGQLNDVVLVEQERHATGVLHLELPRGFGEVGLTGEQNALKELKEETGYIGEKAFLLGATYTDTGITNAKVSFFHVPITQKVDATPELREAIQQVQLISVNEIWNKIQRSEIMDSFTIQALSFFERTRSA